MEPTLVVTIPELKSWIKQNKSYRLVKCRQRFWRSENLKIYSRLRNIVIGVLFVAEINFFVEIG